MVWSTSGSFVIKTIMSFGLRFIVLNIERFGNEMRKARLILYIVFTIHLLRVWGTSRYTYGIMQNTTFVPPGHICRHIFSSLLVLEIRRSFLWMFYTNILLHKLLFLQAKKKKKVVGLNLEMCYDILFDYVWIYKLSPILFVPHTQRASLNPIAKAWNVLFKLLLRLDEC